MTRERSVRDTTAGSARGSGRPSATGSRVRGAAGRRQRPATRPGPRSAAWGRAWALLLLGILGLACVSTQRVPIRVEPADAELYVDGEAVSVLPSELELRSDQDHKLFFKRPGYRPELVVLESVRGADRDRLEPAEVQVRLRSERTTGREIRVETEDAGAASPD